MVQEPVVRLNPDFSVAQVALDRRTVVMLYAPTGEGMPEGEEAVAWTPEVPPEP